MKKFLSIILAILMIVTSVPVAFAVTDFEQQPTVQNGFTAKLSEPEADYQWYEALYTLTDANVESSSTADYSSDYGYWDISQGMATRVYIYVRLNAGDVIVFTDIDGKTEEYYITEGEETYTVVNSLAKTSTYTVKNDGVCKIGFFLYRGMFGASPTIIEIAKSVEDASTNTLTNYECGKEYYCIATYDDVLYRFDAVTGIHVFEDGICTGCGYECSHENYTDEVCDVCGRCCDHTSVNISERKCDYCGRDIGSAEITVGETVSVNDITVYEFTPEYSGTYIVSSSIAEEYSDPCAELYKGNVYIDRYDDCYDENGEIIDYDFNITYNYEAGQNYYLVVSDLSAIYGFTVDVECETHNWSESKCLVCGTVCAHADQTGSACEVCGATLHTCDFSGEWKHDSKNHWKECDCGETEEVAHSYIDGVCECGTMGITNIEDFGCFPDKGWYTEEGIPEEISPNVEGKIEWVNGDEITITMNSETYGTQTAVMTYQDGSWVGDIALAYDENEDLDYLLTVAYGKVDGTEEYLLAEHIIDGSTLQISFEYSDRLYSRLRLVGDANESYEISVTEFMPAGLGNFDSYNYTLTADDNGNAFLYGCFAEGSILTINGVDCTLNYLNGTEFGKSYAICAVHSGTEATCKGVLCENCGLYFGEKDLSKHTLVQVDAKAPTCTEIGWDAYEYCTACTYTTYVELPVDSDAHDWSNKDGVCAYGCGTVCDHAGQTGSACEICGTVFPTSDYYLVGFINGANHGCEEDSENDGDYKFVDGKLTAKFDSDCYVYIKTGGNEKHYLLQEFSQEQSVKLYNSTIPGIQEKLYIPGGENLEFTLVVNDDDTLSLSYEIVPEDDTPDFSDAKVLTTDEKGYLCIDGEKIEVKYSYFGDEKQTIPGGKYVLNGDLNSKNAFVLTDEEAISIDLNGYTWNMSYVYLFGYGPLSVYDTSADETGKIISDSYNTIYLVEDDAVFSLYGGTIENTNCSTDVSAIMSLDADVYLYGGKIKSQINALNYYMDTELTYYLGDVELETGEGYAHIDTWLGNGYEPKGVIDVSNYTGDSLTLSAEIEQEIERIKVFQGIKNAADAEKFIIEINSTEYTNIEEYDEATGIKYCTVYKPVFTQQPTVENNFTVESNAHDASYQWTEIKIIEDKLFAGCTSGTVLGSYSLNAGDIITVKMDPDVYSTYMTIEDSYYSFDNYSAKKLVHVVKADGVVEVKINSSYVAEDIHLNIISREKLEGETGKTLSEVGCGKNYACLLTTGRVAVYSDLVLNPHVKAEDGHFCSICGAEFPCVDNDNNHKCDYCDETLSECKEKGTTHLCELCGERMSECADTSDDHYCDHCYERLTYCDDGDNDHSCDLCKAVMSQCADEDEDHKCDICGEDTPCHDVDSDNKCDLCGKALIIITLSLTDSWGDGWNGNAVEIYNNNKRIGSYTINSGSESEHIIVLNPFKEYSFKWVKGSYANECSLVININGETVKEFESSELESKATGDVLYTTIALECEHDNFTDGKCNYCGYECEHSYTDGVCDECGYECAHEWGEGVLTRPTRTEEGCYTYTCSICKDTKIELVERASNYAEFKEQLEKVKGYLDENLTDSMMQEVNNIINFFDLDENHRFIKGEENTVSQMIRQISEFVEVVEEGIADGTALKADYTEIDEAIAALDEKLADVNLTDEAKAELEAIKAQLTEMKKDPLSSKADVEELMNEVEELEAGVEDGTIVLVDASKIFAEYDIAHSDDLEEKYGREKVDKVFFKIHIKNPEVIDSIWEYADSVTGTVAETADEIEEIKRMFDDLYEGVERCIIGTHNVEEYEVISPAKCGTNAIESGTCTLCVDVLTREVENSALTHSFTKYEEAVAPTCDKTGVEVASCDNGCNATDEREIDALNHKDTLVEVDAKAATCDAVGWEAYEYCTACDYTTYEEIPATNHKDTLVKVDAKAATCDAIGWEAYEYCTACDYTTYKEIPATNHKDTIVKVDAKAATCDAIGWEAYEYCTVCDYTTYKEIPATNHKDTLVKVDAKAATCDAVGWEAYEYCTACDYTTYKEIPATSHKDTLVKVDAKAATCDAVGWEAYEYCTACDYTTYKEIPAMNHKDTLVEVDAKAATCDAIGWEAYEYCTACDYTTYKEIPATNHKDTLVKVDAKAATCDAIGWEAYEYCTACDYTTYKEIPATGHSYEAEETKTSTCTEAGTMTYTCACGDVYTEEISALGHSFTDYISNEDATCEADGTKTAECANGCGKTDTVADEGSKLGHTDEDGDKICEVCEGEISEICAFCGNAAHESQTAVYVCMLVTLIKFVVELAQVLGILK